MTVALATSGYICPAVPTTVVLNLEVRELVGIITETETLVGTVTETETLVGVIGCDDD